MIFVRLALTLVAIVIIVIGVITTPSPIPFGVILIALGFLLLAIAAPALVRRIRRNWGWLNRRLIALEKKAPEWLARPLRETDPSDGEDDEEEEENENDAAKTPRPDYRGINRRRHARPNPLRHVY